MRKISVKNAVLAAAIALFAPATLLAQKDEKDKTVKEERKDVQQIIITKKSGADDKVVVEINGDKITINGKPFEDYKDKGGDIKVKLNRLKDVEALTLERAPRGGVWNFNDNNDNFRFYSIDENRAMLGVTTQKVTEGAEVQSITPESAAEKAGLKENDIITKVDDKKIASPDDLSEAIKAHKPGDKVTITYLREGKEKKATVELTKWKGAKNWSMGDNFKIDLGDMDFESIMPKIKEIPIPKAPFGQNWTWTGGGPKLGLSVQDTDDGKGVKVIEVDDESNAEKAGIKNNDIITEVDGKAINNADDMVRVVKESKDKVSVMIKLKRDGKTQNVEVKMPRKLKTADL
ncbi:MAG TPA: PDZ domain-containing protein [Chitinophagaceae bacterium]|nr:PDZ domain-containing protein [Chitinophagaceae bacterium]HRF18074.1 PDZ domain-containing protein [Chitinophagaceae bacterium]